MNDLISLANHLIQNPSQLVRVLGLLREAGILPVLAEVIDGRDPEGTAFKKRMIVLPPLSERRNTEL